MTDGNLVAFLFGSIAVLIMSLQYRMRRLEKLLDVYDLMLKRRGNDFHIVHKSRSQS